MKNQELSAWKYDNRYAFAGSIIVALISAVSFYIGSFYGIKTDIQDIKKDLSYIVKSQDEYFERNKEIQIRLGIQGDRLTRLETLAGVKNSEGSATLK